MNESEILRQYGKWSVPAAAVDIDVTARVMQTLRDGRESRWSATMRPLAVAVAASWMLALVTGFFVQDVWSDLQDPLTALVTPFVVSLQ